MKQCAALLFAISCMCSFGLINISCTPSDSPRVGSQTNWMTLCEDSADCGELSCQCGACSRSCEGDSDCSGMADASCVSSEESGAIALCDGQEPTSPGICMPLCVQGDCAEGMACVAGACSPLGESSVNVTVDTSLQYQTLEGFGASLAYTEEAVVSHPEKSDLFDALFLDSGFTVLRLRDRYDPESEEPLLPAQEIVDEAARRTSQAPKVLLTSGSPPAELKANASRQCAGNPEDCTLIRQSNGDFDYPGFAEHWRSSLLAHAALGINVDYLSIQNNPNWVPEESNANDACKFLPTEGSELVDVDGEEVEVTYPGYSEALAAVQAAVEGVASPPLFIAPEVSSLEAAPNYFASLDSMSVAALTFHMYEDDTLPSDPDALAKVKEWGEELDVPIFQTEMRGEGFDTAVLVHSALTTSDASMYLQAQFVSASDEPQAALVSIDEDSFALQGPYHALRHFSYRTAPGWFRVEAESEDEDLIVSAFMSPKGDALTLVLINTESTAHDVQLDLDELKQLRSSELYRTTFDGIEQFSHLGSLPPSAQVRVPGHAALTIALAE